MNKVRIFSRNKLTKAKSCLNVILKFNHKWHILLIEKEEIGKVLQFVSEYWEKLKNDPDNESLKILPSKFWMKSFGGPVGNAQGPKGRWITTLMYTEDPEIDKAFKEVLTRWQVKGQQTSTDLPTKSPDLIQIGSGKK